MGRVVESKTGTSSGTHDITATKPTMYTLAKTFYDDPNDDSTAEHGVGDGNPSWTQRYHGTGAGDHNDTRYKYDARNRRCLTIPPAGACSLVAYDNLGRVTASATYSSTSNLDPGDDPATTEARQPPVAEQDPLRREPAGCTRPSGFMDPGDATPADALVSNTYYDRRGLTWATRCPQHGDRLHRVRRGSAMNSNLPGNPIRPRRQVCQQSSGLSGR